MFFYFPVVSNNHFNKVMIKIPVVFLFLCIDVSTWTSLVYAIKLQPSKTSTTVFEGSSYAVTCESQNDINNIEWYRAGRSNPISTHRYNNIDVFVEQDTGKSRLLFPAVTPHDEGRYECKAGKSIIGFDLKVMKHMKLLPQPDTYYALFGEDIELKCGLDTNEKTPTLLWRFNEENNIIGDHYRQTKEGLLVLNVTEKLIGNYTCTYYFTNDDVTDTASMKISLKPAKIPVIEEIYSNNTLHVLRSTTANVKCKVSAEPSAKIQWYKNKAELDLRKSNATIENKDNESILKVFYSTDAYLGNFTCYAWNKFGNTSKTFALVEGNRPETPTLSIGKSSDRSCSLYIYPNPPKQSLITIKVFHKNQKLNNSDWTITNLQLEKENPYSLDQLESSSSYIIKAEICSDYEICTFSNDETCETVAPTTGSANRVMQNIITQFIWLLPAFVIGFYSQ